MTRPEAVVPAAAPDLAPGQPYGAIFGSVEEELVQRGSHDHALFREDNALVYFYLEEATRSTSYAASIKPFQRTKNGRGAWLAMVAQYAGEDKWRAEWQLQDIYVGWCTREMAESFEGKQRIQETYHPNEN